MDDPWGSPWTSTDRSTEALPLPSHALAPFKTKLAEPTQSPWADDEDGFGDWAVAGADSAATPPVAPAAFEELPASDEVAVDEPSPAADSFTAPLPIAALSVPNHWVDDPVPQIVTPTPKHDEHVIADSEETDETDQADEADKADQADGTIGTDQEEANPVKDVSDELHQDEEASPVGDDSSASHDGNQQGTDDDSRPRPKTPETTHALADSPSPSNPESIASEEAATDQEKSTPVSYDSGYEDGSLPGPTTAKDAASPPASVKARKPVLEKYGPMDFTVDEDKVGQLFGPDETAPVKRDVEAQQLDALVLHSDQILTDSFSSIGERKTWYRIARQGSARKHNMENSDYYRHVTWPGSAVQAETIKIVRRWMEEDSFTGKPVLGVSSTRGNLFGWDSVSKPVALNEVFKRAPRPRPISLSSAHGSAMSPSSTSSPSTYVGTPTAKSLGTVSFGWNASGSPARTETAADAFDKVTPAGKEEDEWGDMVSPVEGSSKLTRGFSLPPPETVSVADAPSLSGQQLIQSVIGGLPNLSYMER